MSDKPTPGEFINALEINNKNDVATWFFRVRRVRPLDVPLVGFLLDILTSGKYYSLPDDVINRGTAIVLKQFLSENPKGLDELFLYCIKQEYVSSLTVLIDKGARVNVVNAYYETPLHEGVKTGNLEIVKLLLDKGANIDAKNTDDNTPLHYAHRLNDQRMVDLLIERGARVDIKNKYGFTYAGHLIALSGARNSAFRTKREEERARLEAARALQLERQQAFTGQYTGRGTNYKSPNGIEMGPMKGGGSRRAKGKGRSRARTTKRKQTRKSRSRNQKNQKTQKTQSQS
jgi:hypothetical protein